VDHCRCCQPIGQCARCGGNLVAGHICPTQYWTEEEWTRHKEKMQKFIDSSENKEQQMPNNNDKAALCSIQLLTSNIAEMVATKFPEGTLVDTALLTETLTYLNLVLEMEITKLDEYSQD